MKKCVTVLFFLMMINGLFVGTTVEATSISNTSEIGIVFKTEAPVLPEPLISPKLPDTYMPALPKTSLGTNGKLPSMGDLITSLIWTLLGFSILIVFVGVFSLKNIMLKTI